MLEKNRNLAIIFCTSTITLLIIYTGIVLINFFTEEEIITKESIVGIDPVTLEKSIMIYKEPLTVVLGQQPKKAVLQEKIEESISEEFSSNNEEIEFSERQKEKKEEIINQEGEKLENDIVEVAETQNDIPTEYKGFATIGKIEIPKTGVNTPILNQVTVKGMENAPCLLYSTGDLNQNGNNLIVGHNYRNGTIFSNNKNLTLGDKIYVTTLEGNCIEYSIYDKFVTTAEDVSYIKRDTNNKPEITLSCCTDDDEYRIIILART